MSRILFISYGHEKMNLASTIQNHRLSKALAEWNEVTILSRSFKKEHKPFSIWSPDVFIFDRILYKALPFLSSVFSFDRLLWSKKAFRLIENQLPSFDCVIIPYEPYTVRSLQKKIRRCCSSLKIVSLLYDPYYDNIFFSSSRVGKKFRWNIERGIVYNSDYVVVNSPRMYKVFLQRYPMSNVKWLPFCGKEKVDNSLKQRNEPFIMVHAGNLFGKRTIDCLNHTVTFMKRDCQLLAEKLRIYLYGSICQGYEKVVDDGNDDVIIKKSAVSQTEIESVLADADALLIIDPMDESNFSYPSKLCEYFQYKKIIIGFSGKGTPSYEALKETNNIVHSTGEEEMMAKDLLSILEKGAVNEMPDGYDKQFYPVNVAKKLINIIQQNSI